MSNPDKVYFVTIHSKDSEFSGGVYRFRLTHSLQLNSHDCIMQITQFHGLNNIPNIEKDMTFLDKTLTKGFYDTNDLQIFMQTVLNLYYTSPKVVCFFDKNTLKFRFISDSAFQLTGTLLTFLGFSSNVIDSTEINGRFDYKTGQTYGVEYEIVIPKSLGLYKDIEYIHILNKSLLMRPHVSAEGDFDNEICKIPLKVAFGSYIVLDHNEIGIENIIYNKMIQTIDLSIVTDSKTEIDTVFTLTLKLMLYEKDTSSFLNENSMNYIQANETAIKTSPVSAYGVVRSITGSLKDARTIYEERRLGKKKAYGINHPLYQFTQEEIDEIEKRWELIKNDIAKKKPLKNK